MKLFNGFFTKRGRDEFYKAIDTAQTMFDVVRYGRTFPDKNTAEMRSELLGIESLLRDTVDGVDQCRQQLREWEKRSVLIGLLQIAEILLLLIVVLYVHFWG